MSIIAVLFFGYIGIVFGGERISEFFLSLSWVSLFLIFFSMFGFLYFGKESSKYFQLRKYISFTVIVTFFLELIGLTTGLIFGEYQYLSNVGFKIFETPLVIGFTWAIVVMGVISFFEKFFYLKLENNKLSISQKLKRTNYVKAIIYATIIGLTTTLFDYILEPAAIKMGLWYWSGGVIPISNYLSWFIISFFLGLIFYYKREKYLKDINLKNFYMKFSYVAIFILLINLTL